MSEQWKTYSLPSEKMEVNRYVWFKGTCAAGTRLAIYTEDVYALWNNGNFLGYGPSRSGHPLYYYDEYALDTSRENHITLLVHGRKHFPALWTNCDTVMVNPWRVKNSDMYNVSSPDTAVGDVGFLEYIDLSNNEYSLYPQTDFNCGDWAEALAGFIPTGARLIPRSIPYFSEKERFPIKVDRIKDEICFDFGEMVYGRIQIVGCKQSNSELWLDYIENLEQGWAFSEGRREMYSDKISGNGITNFCWKSFNKRGFRYVVIRGKLQTAPEVSLLEWGYPKPENTPSGNFLCSDERVNHLWNISRKTLDICLDDIYLDCPHRDQAQWMDAFVTSKLALGMYGISDLTRKCILQHLICSFQDGRMLSPSISGWHFMPDYAMIANAFALWYVQTTGDVSLIDEIWDNALGSLRYLEQYADPVDGLLENVPGAYLDNAIELCRLGKSAAMNSLYIAAWKAMATMGKLSGRITESIEYSNRTVSLTASFHRAFDAPDGSRTLIDATGLNRKPFWNYNFYCELPAFRQANAARVDFTVSSTQSKTIQLEFASYGPAHIICNGSQIAFEPRQADWARPLPAYAPVAVSLELHSGNNVISFIVDNNFLNWDFYFRSDDIPDWGDGCITPLDANDNPLAQQIKRPPRYWEPPILSQTTHGYAAFADLVPNEALLACLRPCYPRNYISIRVPLFCTENSKKESLHNWVLPANTPWTMSFFINGLFATGHKQAAVDMMMRAWKIMLDNNATNTWEEWNCNSSLCHAWGGTPIYFLQHDILGVHPEETHNGCLDLHPFLPKGWTFARGRVLIAAGKWIDVSLERKAPELPAFSTCCTTNSDLKLNVLP